MGSAVIGALRVNLGIDTAQFKSSLSGVRKAMDQAGRSMQNFGTSLSKTVSAPIAGAAAAVTAAVTMMAKDVQELQKSAQISNTTFEEFQRLAFAAKSVGIESDKLSDIYKDVNDRVGDFVTTGGGPMADFFEKIAPKIGITADAFKNLSGPQALQLYYDSLVKAGASQQEMTFYLEAMASDATALIPLLAKGGEGFRKLGEGAATISEDQAKGLQAYNDGMRALGEAIRAVTIAIATSGLLEWVTGIVTSMAELLTVLSQTNPEILKWGTAIAGIAVVVGPAIASLGLLVTVLAGISAPVLAGVAAVAALAAGALILQQNWQGIIERFPLVGQIVETTTAVMRTSMAGVLENARLLATGVAQLLTGDFAGAWNSARELVHNFWQTLGSIIETIFPNLLASINSNTAQIVTTVQGVASSILAAFSALPAQMLQVGVDLMSGLWSGIQSGATAVVEGAKGIASSVVDSVKSVFDINSPSRVMQDIGTNVMQGLNNGITNFSGTVTDTATGIASNVTGAFSQMESIGGTLSNSLSSAFKGILDGSKTVKSALLDVLSSLTDMFFNQGFQAIFGGGMGGGGGGGLLGALFGGIGKLFSFDGGGFTGYGARSGGLDGKGGFLSVMHPNETVIDHTKLGGQRQDRAGGVMRVIVGVDPKNGSIQGYVDSSIQQATPGIQSGAVGQANRMAPAAVAQYNATRSGGDYRNG